jgi:hypothetical protein
LRFVIEASRIRYREPYNARHSSISWSLMMGKNLLKLAKEDGHGVQTMLARYAAWIEGATEDGCGSDQARDGADNDREARLRDHDAMATRWPLDDPQGRLSWREFKCHKGLRRQSRRDSNPCAPLPLDLADPAALPASSLRRLYRRIHPAGDPSRPLDESKAACWMFPIRTIAHAKSDDKSDDTR